MALEHWTELAFTAGVLLWGVEILAGPHVVFDVFSPLQLELCIVVHEDPAGAWRVLLEIGRLDVVPVANVRLDRGVENGLAGVWEKLRVDGLQRP